MGRIMAYPWLCFCLTQDSFGIRRWVKSLVRPKRLVHSCLLVAKAVSEPGDRLHQGRVDGLLCRGELIPPLMNLMGQVLRSGGQVVAPTPEIPCRCQEGLSEDDLAALDLVFDHINMAGDIPVDACRD